MWLKSLTQAKCSLIPRPVHPTRVTRGGLEASAIAEIFRECDSGNCWGRLETRLGEVHKPHMPVEHVRGEKVYPQSRSPFSASLRTFCLTGRRYLNMQQYRLFCSLLFYWQTRVYFCRIIDGVEFWTLAQRRPFFQQPICMPRCKRKSVLQPAIRSSCS